MSDKHKHLVIATKMTYLKSYCKQISFALLFFIELSVDAQVLQNLEFKHLSPKNGLPHNSITKICRDYKGFVWLGSEEGLFRYDGYEYTAYKNDELAPHSIANDYIYAIYEDKDKNLWVASNNCLNLYNRDTDSFERYYLNNDPQSKWTVFTLFEDTGKNFWIGTSNGLVKFDRKTKSFKSFLPEFKEDLSVRAIAEDKNGILWVGGDNEHTGLIKFDGAKVLQTFKNDPKNRNSLSSNHINVLAIDKYNNLWIGNRKTGLDKFNLDKQTFFNYPNDKGRTFLNSNLINGLVVDKYNNVWLATVDGLNIIDFKTNKVHVYTSNPDDPGSILSNNYWCNYIDDEGTVWLGSRSGGVDIYDSRFTKFLHLSASNKTPTSPNANTISCFVEDRQGNMWVGTDGGGINFWNRRENVFKYFTTTQHDTNHLANNKILAMMLDQENTLWVGMWDGGIDRFKIMDDKLILVKRYEQLIPNVKSSNSLFKIFQAKNGDIWFGTWKYGLFLYDKTKDGFIRYPRKGKKIISYPQTNEQRENLQPLFDNDNILNIGEDDLGHIWVSTESSGAYMIDNQGDVTHYAYGESGKNMLQSPKIFFIYQDTQKRIWAGTSGGGLNLLNPDKKTFKIYTTKDGLPHNTIVGMLEDKQGNLWISTNRGIAKIALSGDLMAPTLQCNLFDISDGLQGDQYIGWATFKNSGGEFFFGGSNGFNVFDPNNLSLNSVKPQVYITDIMVLNKSLSENKQNSILKKSILETKEITLAHEQKIITIKFAALNFINSSKNQYMYQLVDFDANWINSNGKREITYTNLDPGTYIFRVKASNNDGVWNEEGASLKIIVLPPWWATWWFRTLMGVFVVGSTVAFFQIRMRNVRMQKAKLEKLVDIRTHELRQANVALDGQRQEIFAQNEELQQQSEELQQQRDYLEEANEVISQRLEDIKILSEIGQQITASFNLTEIIEKVYHHLNQLMDAPNFEIGVLDTERGVIDYYGYLDKNRKMDHNINSIHQEGTFTHWMPIHQQDVFIKDVENEITQYFTPEQSLYYTNARSKTLIYLPLLIEEKMIGVLVAKSFKKQAYTDVHFSILKNLAVYVAIALDNAQAYQLLQTSNEQIQAKNKQIDSSIKAAKTIQQAILPHQAKMDELLKDYFVIYRPKDVVSGDFYWLDQIGNQTILVVADCTGHGVPGAFMTLIGNTLLDKIVCVLKNTDPAQILEKLDEEIQRVLRQKDTSNNNGMDLVVLCMERAGGDKTKITFCGAKNPMYYTSSEDTDGMLHVLEGDRKSIGGAQNEGLSFHNQEVILAKDSVVYVGTDGLVDQNNAARKRFGKQKLKTLLEQNVTRDLSRQQEALEKALATHQEGTEQRDEILFMGVRV